MNFEEEQQHRAVTRYADNGLKARRNPESFDDAIRFCSIFCVWITPVFLSVRQKETACGSFRFYSAHRAAGFERSHVLCGHPPLLVHLSFSRFLFRRRGNEGLAAQCFLLIAYLFGFVMFSAGSTLGLRAPNPRQRAKKWKPHCGLSGLSSRCGGLGYHKLKTLQKAARHNHRTAFATLGYTERPVRL